MAFFIVFFVASLAWDMQFNAKKFINCWAFPPTAVRCKSVMQRDEIYVRFKLINATRDRINCIGLKLMNEVTAIFFRSKPLKKRKKLKIWNSIAAGRNSIFTENPSTNQIHIWLFGLLFVHLQKHSQIYDVLSFSLRKISPTWCALCCCHKFAQEAIVLFVMKAFC